MNVQTVEVVGFTRAYRIRKFVLFLWLFITALQYSDLSLPGLRIGALLSTFLLLLINFAGRPRLSKKVNAFFLPVFLYVVWKTFELLRAPADFFEAAIAYGEFVCVALVCLYVIPSWFSLKGWLNWAFKSYFLIAGIFLVLHLVVPDSTLMAGWDKGYSWLFAHPNVAGMYFLVIILLVIGLLSLGWISRLRGLAAILLFTLLTLLTNSRTALGAIAVSFFFCLFGMVFKRLWVGKSRSHALVKYLLSAVVLMSAGFVLYQYLGSASDDQLDELSTGRLAVWTGLLADVPNQWLGVGLLAPGDSLEFNKIDRGAGIDGLFVNILYAEGWIGLGLFILVQIKAMMLLSQASSVRMFPFLVSFALGAIAFSVTESHYWLRSSPLTVIVLATAAVIGKQMLTKNLRNF